MTREDVLKILDNHKSQTCDQVEELQRIRINLRGADLHDADLHGINLYGADLCGANLSGADLSGADLRFSDLCNANLTNTDLRHVNLYSVTLYGTNLPLAKNLHPYYKTLDKGVFVGYKKVPGNFIIELEICKDAKCVSLIGEEYRCDKARVLCIRNINGTKLDLTEIPDSCICRFTYKVDNVIREQLFCNDPFKECAPGIYFFRDIEKAIESPISIWE